MVPVVLHPLMEHENPVRAALGEPAGLQSGHDVIPALCRLAQRMGNVARFPAGEAAVRGLLADGRPKGDEGADSGADVGPSHGGAQAAELPVPAERDVNANPHAHPQRKGVPAARGGCLSGDQRPPPATTGTPLRFVDRPRAS